MVIGLSLPQLTLFITAALGRSALLLSSALAFNLVKYWGAAYLIFLAVQKLRAGSTAHWLRRSRGFWRVQRYGTGGV